MSLQTCAEIVQRGDPDRFRAAMAAPVAARKVLFPLYAFNVEVARAPWVTQEPLIAEMRLQWWADALEEIASGRPVRRNDVTTPLAEVLAPGDTLLLLRNVDARRRDARRERFQTAADLESYLSDTAGTLMWASVRALDPTGIGGEPFAAEGAGGPDAQVRAYSIGTKLGLANYFLGVPRFLQLGLNPLPEMSEAEFAGLIEAKLVSRIKPQSRAQRIAELSAWSADAVLRTALRDPAAVAEGRLEPAPFRRDAMLLWRRLWA